MEIVLRILHTLHNLLFFVSSCFTLCASRSIAEELGMSDSGIMFWFSVVRCSFSGVAAASTTLESVFSRGVYSIGTQSISFRRNNPELYSLRKP